MLIIAPCSKAHATRSTPWPVSSQQRAVMGFHALRVFPRNNTLGTARTKRGRRAAYEWRTDSSVAANGEPHWRLAGAMIRYYIL